VRRTLDRGKHVFFADVPVRSLTAGHEVRLDSQRGCASINPVSHLSGRQDVVDATAARRQLASCHEHADQCGARLHSPKSNGAAHRPHSSVIAAGAPLLQDLQVKFAFELCDVYRAW
jgi:hypothetical protein